MQGSEDKKELQQQLAQQEEETEELQEQLAQQEEELQQLLGTAIANTNLISPDGHGHLELNTILAQEVNYHVAGS